MVYLFSDRSCLINYIYVSWITVIPWDTQKFLLFVIYVTRELQRQNKSYFSSFGLSMPQFLLHWNLAIGVSEMEFWSENSIFTRFLLSEIKTDIFIRNN